MRYKQESMKCRMKAVDREDSVTDIKLYIKQDIISMFMILYDIFNCNWVDTRWQ